MSFLQNELPGIPKGLAFARDGSCLIATFSDIHRIAIYDIIDQKILPDPRQTVQGETAGISRPEDVALSPDGKWYAVTNSDRSNVAFYPFDPLLKKITHSFPEYVLEPFSFPHGIAFSADGSFLVITEFGAVGTNSVGDIAWNPKARSRFQVFKSQ